MNAETYIKRIRNANKKSYAAAFWAWIQDGSGQEPVRPSGLNYMAAQAVRTSLYCFQKYGAQHGSIWAAGSSETETWVGIGSASKTVCLCGAPMQNGLD